jgi:tRNA-uridine 2-sulfurtransferase
MQIKKRVVIGLSGGVDSSVAAGLLLEQSYEVIGVFMKNWHDESVTLRGECPWTEDSADAMMVAAKLGIPFVTLDFSKEYYERIVTYMFDEYGKGRTPNPDVLCNREIKFDLFVQAADKLGADYVATGHYCRKAVTEEKGQKVCHLLAGLDAAKDQSYFLCQLSQEQLARSLFPVGHLLKEEVRAIAGRLGLITADKKDSQGLCFVGKVKLPVFLQQQLKPQQGDIRLLPSGLPSFAGSHYASAEPLRTDDRPLLDALCLNPRYDPSQGILVGQHQGAHFFTAGQRKGLQTGGMDKPIYVIATDVNKNIVYAGMGDDHPGLYRSGVFVRKEDVHWIRHDRMLRPGENSRYRVRIRYRQPLQEATLVMHEHGLYVVFDKPCKAVAAGQFVVWYDQDECLGSGVIN